MTQNEVAPVAPANRFHLEGREQVPAGEVWDLSAVQHRLAADGRMAGFEVHQRFYEIGSPKGLAELETALVDRRG